MNIADWIKIPDTAVSALLWLLRKIPGFKMLKGAAAGDMVDRSCKTLMTIYLEQQGFKEGEDFVVPPGTAKCNDFLVTNDIAQKKMQDLIHKRITFVEPHWRNGVLVSGHYRKLA